MNYILVPSSSLEGRNEFAHHRRLRDGRVICPPKDILLLAGVQGIEVVRESDLLAIIREEEQAENAEVTND